MLSCNVNKPLKKVVGEMSESNQVNTMSSAEEKSIILQWIQRFRLSSRIRKLSRDLSDGVLIAEILHQLFPRLVELHNYTKGFAIGRKLDNWETLNRKVFKKLEIHLTPKVIHAVANGDENSILAVLIEIMVKAEQLGVKS